MTEEAYETRGCGLASAQVAPLSREQLYELVWREPMLRVAERLGVSSSYMARVCTELRVPRPPRGYWAQLAYGKAPAQPALPEVRAGDITEWRSGDFIGTNERAAKRIARIPSPTVEGAPVAAQKIRRRSHQPTAGKPLHPLLIGIKPFFEKTRDSENGILRPFKRLLVDVLSSKERLDVAIDAADKLFRTLTSRGHRVTIAPTSGQMRRADVDLRETPEKNRNQHSAWAPERPTVVFIGDVPIGLTLFEMTEIVEMLYVGNSQYVPVRNLTPEQRRRYSAPRYWTTAKDLASGRLCLQVYCPSWRVSWVKRWPEDKPGQFSSMVPDIVRELESAGPDLSAKLEAARILAEEEDRRWKDEQKRRREADERARQEKFRQDARRDLLAAIAGWDEARRIDAYFTAAALAAEHLDADERHRLLSRIALARELVGKNGPLEMLLHWRAPGERS
ncbi:hypothetical protein RR42_m3811 [Cupriavidus basilensis]|uniref:Uncharacterized protein n=1 Tax=Cupriavidus basilensis TaxID=68895 RepID=A0A0C4YKN4_9BURK|nr:hypothetical protein RR42_m3811 [Cupriavidus basilensis]